MAKATPGRNDPCWCGSGRKYKRCHYLEDLGAEVPSGGGSPRLGSSRDFPPGILLGPEEQEGMRTASRFNATLLDHLRPHVCRMLLPHDAESRD